MIYFDNAATTVVCESAASKAVEMMTRQYGNPSSVHDFGYNAEKILKESRKKILSHMGSKSRNDELIFTSGGTESNNIAIFGALSCAKHIGKKVFFSDSEHASVHNISTELSKRGYDVKYIPTRGGKIDFDFCEKNFSADTALISCMYANNETGALYDIKALSDLRKKLCPKALLHTDAVQAFGKTDCLPAWCGADLISVSGHKVHAPKGVGALYIREGVRIPGIFFGGGQEKNIRPGTESLPLIAAFAAACDECLSASNILFVEKLRSHLLTRLSESLPSVTVNIPSAYIPHVVSLTLPSIKSEVMLRYLSAKGIYVSAGSACTSKHKENRVLSAYGLDAKSADYTIRISFCEYNSLQEIDAFISVLSDGINSLVSTR